MRDLRATIITKIADAIGNLSSLGRFILGALIVLFVVAVVWLVCDVSASFLVTVPMNGGTVTLGIVGKPRLINPVLAVSVPDKDMDALVYSGLTRWDIKEQKLIPDLAESWAISPDDTVYTFILKTGLTFQDGTPLTADDILFTVNAIQNPALHSPLAANWAGVTAKKIDAHTVQFILPAPYAPFIENTSVGILPAHTWQKIPAEQFATAASNTRPIGSGPFAIGGITGPANNPSAYALTPFVHFSLGTPHLGRLVVHFFSDTETAATAAENHQIDELSNVSPDQITPLQQRGFFINEFSLPRVFGIFFNQTNSSVLADPAVRQALNTAVDRTAIVANVFGNSALAISGPIPPAFLPTSAPDSSVPAPANSTLAENILDKAGWIVNNDGIREKKKTIGTTTLSFAIATAPAPELVATANLLANRWQAIGVNVSVKVFDSGFEDQVIEPRNYDALFFGQDIGRGLDLYPFWASSETADPGLNIALYKNKSVDALLGDMRTTASSTVRQADIAAFNADFARDLPAIMLYEQNLSVGRTETIHGDSVGPIANISERLSDAYRWYAQTEEIWSVFAPKTATASYQ